MQGNDKVAFVQARWVFANADESTLTRVQEISLNYHLKCEQFARFATSAFWNFNGERFHEPRVPTFPQVLLAQWFSGSVSFGNPLSD